LNLIGRADENKWLWTNNLTISRFAEIGPAPQLLRHHYVVKYSKIHKGHGLTHYQDTVSPDRRMIRKEKITKKCQKS